MKNLIIALILIGSIFLSGCPKQSDLAKGFKASSQISNVGTQAAIAVGDLYTANVISFEMKGKFVAVLRTVQTNGAKFNTILSELKKTYGENVPKSEINALDVFFNQNIIAPFVEILVEAGKLSAAAAEKIYLAIAALKQIVFTVATIFGASLSNSVSFEAVKNREFYAQI